MVCVMQTASRGEKLQLVLKQKYNFTAKHLVLILILMSPMSQINIPDDVKNKQDNYFKKIKSCMKREKRRMNYLAACQKNKCHKCMSCQIKVDLSETKECP